MGFVFTVVHARVCLSKFDSAIKCELINSNQQREIQINVNKEDKTMFRHID